MQVVRLAGALGAEIRGLDLAGELTAATALELRNLLNEHEVLFLRDQAIDPEQQRALAAVFGPCKPTRPTVPCPAAEVMILESTPENPSKIEVWHSDMTFRQHPPGHRAARHGDSRGGWRHSSPV